MLTSSLFNRRSMLQLLTVMGAPVGRFAFSQQQQNNPVQMRTIEEFYRTEDGNDWYPAIMRAQDSFHASTQPNDFRGFTLIFGPREYQFSNSIHLIRKMSITGSGGATSGTVFKFPAGMHGIISHRPTTAPAQTPGAGDNSLIERIIIKGGGENAVQAHGVIMHARTILRDVQITLFSGNGLHIEGNLGAPQPTETSLWQIQNCSVDSCQDGLYVHGPDANAGCAIALDCRDNRGWGINDESFLGNTYVACHTNNNRSGSYRCIDPNARSLFLNCYSEGGQPLAMIRSPSIVLGGMVSVDPTAKPLWLHPSGFVNPIRGITWRNTGNPLLGGFLGGTGGANAALELHRFTPDASEDPHPYRIQYGYTGQAGWWELVFANLGTSPFRFSTTAADVGGSQVWMENGIYLGRIAERIKVHVHDGPPSDPTETWHRGDRILNSRPVPGDLHNGWSGWICVESGNPGVWKGFGQIAS